MKRMTKVRVRAEREGRLWVLHIEGGGVTQARSLGEMAAVVTDYVCLTRNVAPEDIEVEVIGIDPGAGLQDEIAAARRAQVEARQAQESAAAQLRRAAGRLRDQGLNGVEIATVLGVSKQRVSQLTAGHAPKSGPRLST